jgi:hypothetical protein
MSDSGPMTSPPVGRIQSIPDAIAALTRPGGSHLLLAMAGLRLELHRLAHQPMWRTDRRPVLVLCWGGEFMIEMDTRERAYLTPGDLFTIAGGRRYRFVASGDAFAIIASQSGAGQ